jgi:hypothetical protein
MAVERRRPSPGEVAFMRVRGLWVLLAVLAVVASVASQARADKKEVKTTKEWKGSVDDEKLQKEASEFITDGKALEKLWKAWKVEGKVPEVDFKKEIVIVITASGSKVNAIANLDDKGNLEVLGMGTLDLAPGFRYVIATVSRDGVKTVNKKDLPKE